MQRLLLTITIFSLLLMPGPAFADEASDYIENEVDEWEEIALGNGYGILESVIDTIGEFNINYYIDLAPGTYKFYASGGMNVDDLDLYAYDEYGDEIDSDTEGDKIPILEFTIDERQEIELLVNLWSFMEGYDEAYYCLVMTTEEEGGQIYSYETEEVEPEYRSTPGPSSFEADLSDVDFGGFAEETLGFWEEEAEYNGYELIDSDIVPGEGDVVTIDIALDPGYYTIWAESDQRCNDLDLGVFDENNNLLAADQEPSSLTVCSFLLEERMNITVDFALYEFVEGYEETLIAYVIGTLGEITDDQRLDYIEEQLDSLLEYPEMYGQGIIDSGLETLSPRHQFIEFELDLDEGYYEAMGIGGRMIVDLDMAVYDENGDLMDEDNYPDNWPWCYFELDESGAIFIEVSAQEFLGDAEEGYFAWALVQGEPEWDEEEWDYPVYEGDEEDLMDMATELGQEWLDSAEENEEWVIETFVEPLHNVGEDVGWVYEVELDEGTYYVYAQGDDVCLLDLDMQVYDQSGETVDSNEEVDNSPWCVIVVDDGPETFEIVVYAYELACDVGYFWCAITVE